MFVAVFLCSAALSASPAPPPASAATPAELKAYESARAKAGRDADAHIKLALWCEAHGLKAARLKHLAIAVLSDPGNTTARGLMGLVAAGGRWIRPDAFRRPTRLTQPRQRGSPRTTPAARSSRSGSSPPSDRYSSTRPTVVGPPPGSSARR